MIRSNLNGCRSSMIVGCITGNNGSSTLQTIAQNDLVIASPVYGFNTSISGTGTIGAGAQVRLFVNSTYVSGFTQGSATTSFQFTGLNLRIGDTLRVYRQTGTNCPSVSNTVIVTCYNQPPVITATNSRLSEGATSIGGTAAPGASITVNRTSAPTASWTTTANSSGQWSVTVPAMVANQTYTATVTSSSSCNTSSLASAAVTVAPVTTACAGFGAASYGTTAPYTVGGTVNVTATGSVVRLYLDGALVGSQTLNTTGSNINWSITSSEPFYNGGKITVTFQSGSSGTEKTDCSAATSERTISFSAPAAPTMSPPSSTIFAGQTQTYTIGGVQNGLWYSINNAASGLTYAGTQATSNNNLSLTTRPFSAVGTYNLVVEANDFSGCPVSTAAATLTVNASVLPVRFVNIAAQKTNNGNLVKWTVSHEQQVKHYVVERSTDCSSYEAIGTVAFRPTSSRENHYVFTDANANGSRYCYRIRQVDLDGSFVISNVVSLNSKEQQAVSIYPNPAQSQAVIHYSGKRNEILVVEMTDAAGRVVYNQRVQVHQGANMISLTQLSGLGKGSFIIRLVGQDETRYLKLVIQ